MTHRIIVGLIAGLLALAAVGATSYWSVNELADNMARSEHSRRVIAGVARLLAQVVDLDNGSRGYLITGDDEYLEPYTAAEAGLDATVRFLLDLTADNPAQQERLGRLEALLREKRASVRATVGLARTAGAEQAVAKVRTGADRAMMQQIRELLALFEGHERDLLRERNETAERSRAIAVTVILIGSLLGFGLVGTSAVFVRREMRARELVAEEMRRLKTMADEANRAKSNFLANMSHEIRTPMSAIIGYADLLLDRDQTESDRLNAANVIRRNGAHLLTVINDILDLSKIEAGEMTMDVVECSPCRVLSDVASLMRVRALEKQLSLETRTEGRIPETIRSDPNRLRQALMNLVSNAIKFTDSGAVTVTMRLLDPADHPSPRLAFDVADTGVGMNAEQIGKLFQPFSQVDTSSTRRFGGSGLGLMISRYFARNLGGDITVLRSTPGEGSVFQLIITTGPLTGVNLLARCTESMIDLTQTVEGGVLRVRGRVLLAEDGPDNQALLSFYLRKAGADVQVADNGRIACEMVAEAEAAGQPYDVVLMDMQMPELDGYGATALLRKRGWQGPIVALTAHAMAEDRAKCLRAGCTDYLSKPVKRDELLRTVAGYLASHAQAGDSGVLHPSVVDEAVRPFLASFISRLPQYVVSMVRSLEQHDMQGLASVLHQLKGAAGMYGLMPVTEVAGKAEQAVLDQRPTDEVAQLTRDVIATVRRVEGYDAAAER